MARGKLSLSRKRWTASGFAATLVLIGVLPVSLAPRAAAADCAAVDVVVARGTSEAGLLGAEVGQPIVALLQRMLPMTVSSYGVHYPATLVQPASVDQGTIDLVRHVTSRAESCPDQRYVLVGYSQGAYVMDGALGAPVPLGGGGMRLPVAITPRVSAVLLFGNPIRALGWRLPLQYVGRTADYCMAGDPVCQLGGTDWAAHVGYGVDVAAAAAFAANRF